MGAILRPRLMLPRALFDVQALPCCDPRVNTQSTASAGTGDIPEHWRRRRSYSLLSAAGLPVGLVCLEVLARDEVTVGAVRLHRCQPGSADAVHDSVVEKDDLASIR